MRTTLSRFLHRLNGSTRVLAALQERLASLEQDVRHARRAIEELEQLAISGSLSSHRRLIERYGHVRIIADKPVADDSPDHLVPWGTARDNSKNLRFNARLRAWIPVEHITLLDLGCSGGGQVKTFLDQGCYAVGVEGSDFSRKAMRAEWATIPEFLFTADIARPFSVVRANATQELFRFTVITLWEVIEHIHRDGLPGVFANIDRHLAPSGVVIMSVSPNSDVINGVELHQTIEDRAWWLRTVTELGFTHHQDIFDYFGNDFVRGEENACGSFHLVLSRREENPMFRECLPGNQ